VAASFFQADHDLNNLIAQYYVPRLIAQVGEGGMSKGMDGHAGKDLIIKVPCGTLSGNCPALRRLKKRNTKEGEEENDETAKSTRPVIPIAKRPVIRHSGKERALEIDLEAGDGDDEKVAEPSTRARNSWPTLRSTASNSFCAKAVAAFGNRNFATSRRQTPRFAQPGEPAAKGISL